MSIFLEFLFFIYIIYIVYMVSNAFFHICKYFLIIYYYCFFWCSIFATSFAAAILWLTQVFVGDIPILTIIMVFQKMKYWSCVNNTGMIILCKYSSTSYIIYIPSLTLVDTRTKIQLQLFLASNRKNSSNHLSGNVCWFTLDLAFKKNVSESACCQRVYWCLSIEKNEN